MPVFLPSPNSGTCYLAAIAQADMVSNGKSTGAFLTFACSKFKNAIINLNLQLW
jgi:hypothetical protein